MNFHNVGSAPALRPVATPHPEDLVSGIRSGDGQSVRELYNLTSGGIRLLLARHLRVVPTDEMHELVFQDIVRAIQTNDFARGPNIASCIREIVLKFAVQFRLGSVTEQSESCSSSSNRVLAQLNEILRDIPPNDLQMLVSCYIHGDTDEQICSRFGVTASHLRRTRESLRTQFTALKRASLNRLAASART